MRRHFESVLASVRVEDLVGVDWEETEWVDGD